MARIGSFPMVPYMTRFFTANAVICFLAFVVVCLRLYSRILTKAGFGWDDGFILVSMIFGISLLIFEGLLCVTGIGYPVRRIYKNIPLLLSLIATHNTLFVATTLTNKLSILCFYLRVFLGNPKIRLATKIVMGFFCAWSIVSVVGIFAVCRPRAMAAKGNICNRGAIIDNMSALSIFGDIIVLILPLPNIWHLNTNLRTKINISLLFLLGVIVTIIAIIRCVAIVREDFRSPEFAIHSQSSLSYAVLEPNMGILCASLPMLPKLFTTWREKFSVRFNSSKQSEPNSSISLVDKKRLRLMDSSTAEAL